MRCIFNNMVPVVECGYPRKTKIRSYDITLVARVLGISVQYVYGMACLCIHASRFSLMARHSGIS